MKALTQLIAALGSLLAADPVLATQRRREKAAPSAIDKAHTRAADRKRERDRLSRGELWRTLSHEDQLRLTQLRLRRGKAARRMARRPQKRAKGAGPAAPKLLRLGNRMPKAARVQLLREDGRPISGRQ